jgi:hypothetical protein
LEKSELSALTNNKMDFGTLKIEDLIIGSLPSSGFGPADV